MLQTFRSVVVTNSEQEKFEITSAVAELNIFEDLQSNVLSGNILYIDDHGGLNDVRFLGNEKLTIELYENSDGESTTTHEFWLFQVSDNERLNQGTSSYILHFISAEAIINANTKCYSAIKGTNEEAVS